MNEYAIAIGLGATLGLYRISRQRSGQWLDGALLVLFCALLGARAGYALDNWTYFSAHPLESLQIWLGGLSAPGALTGGLLGILLAALILRVNPLRLADWYYPLIPPLAVGAWLGCWLNGVAYGALLPPGTWWGLPALDESGALALRVPVQLGAASALVIFYILMERLTPLPRPSGWLFCLAASWLTLVGLVTSLLRADPQPIWHQLRLESWTYVALFIPLFGGLAALTFKARREEKGKS